MAIAVRGPDEHHGRHWTVYRDGRRVSGYITLDGGRYRVHRGGMHRSPLPPFDRLEDAAQALADLHDAPYR